MTKIKEPVDEPVLQLLVKAVEEDLKDHQEEPSSKYLQPLVKLFSRVASSSPKSSGFYHLFSQLLIVESTKSLNESDKAAKVFKAAQMMQKAVSCHIQSSSWEKSKPNCIKVLTDGVTYGNRCMNASTFNENLSQSKPLLSSAKLTLKSMLTKVKNAHSNLESEQLDADIDEQFTFVQNTTEKLARRIQEL